MFTGIITDIGRIEAAERRGDLRLRIACDSGAADAPLGASIACSGVCLTVVGKGEGWFEADVSAETERRTAPGMWEAGGRLNLERSLKLGDELGGHIVTGHVDGVGTIVNAEKAGDSTRLTIEAGPGLAPFIAAKGSIALDGVSLTVNDVEGLPGGAVRFTVNIIPHTTRETTFDQAETGRRLNVEIDILARYIGRMLENRSTM